MKNVKKAAVVAVIAGGLTAAGAGSSLAASGAQGGAVHSQGIVSGNVIQIPVQVPVNVCGNTITVIGGLNHASGEPCING